MRITPFARPQIIWCAGLAVLGGLAAAALAWGCGAWGWAAAVAVVFAAFLGWALWFFRDPERTVPDGPGLIVAPADGLVTHVDRVESLSVDADGQPAAHGFLPGPAQRVSIFLSVFNVHLNRAPVAGEAAYREYRRGAFFDARLEESHGKNERLDLGIIPADATAPKMVVRQLSGLIARRIVCAAEPGEVLARGAVYGMIKFGSRTSLFVPADARVTWKVKPGDRVKAGETVLGEYGIDNAEG